MDLRCSLGWIAAARGDDERTRAYSTAVEQWARPRDSGLHLALSERNLALAALTRGDFETAYAECVRVSPPGRLEPHRSYAPWMVLDLVESARQTGRTEEARAHVAAAGRAAVTPRLRLLILAARAMAAEEEDAVALFEAALALPGVERWPFDHARVRVAFGALHRRRLRPGDARPELRRAADLFGRLGTAAWQHRAEQELRAAGVTTERTLAGAGAPLTAQQLEVARLAASGLSNKEIGARLYLSPRTVGTRLYRIFPKLGITSRSALRDALDSLRRTGKEGTMTSAHTRPGR
ncbi:response regulator transcription factor [Streptomyces lutosisoli]|uniref:Response regulator transcription factor n=1 Tax=Streptomyces lutosisoli TaxID=2665721 RepID=A0ABW2VQN6_9ACTN